MKRLVLYSFLILGMGPLSVQASALLTYSQCKQVARSVENELSGQMIDEITRASSASCSSDITFTYEYEITDMSISKEEFIDSNGRLRASIMAPWCAQDVDADMAFFFNKVRALTYRYVRSDGVYLGAISFSAKDCATF